MEMHKNPQILIRALMVPFPRLRAHSPTDWAMMEIALAPACVSGRTESATSMDGDSVQAWIRLASSPQPQQVRDT